MNSHTKEKSDRPRVCFFPLSSGDWGGASRVFYTILGQLDRNILDPVVILPAPGPITTKLEELNINYCVWSPLTELTSISRYAQATIKSMSFYIRERIDAVYVNGNCFWRPAEFLAAKILNIPIIAHYHLIQDQPSPGLKWCKAALAVSKYVAEHSMPSSLSKFVVYNTTDLRRFDSGRSLRSDLGIQGEAVVVAFLGQIRAIKGVADFIGMAHNIVNDNAVFIIAGECRDRQKYPDAYTIEDLNRLINGDTRIRYIGYRLDVENIYHTSDIVVAPSRWPEPFGLINIEAGACRKPVVATSTGGIPEIVKDGFNGFLVDVGDIDGLTDRVQKLIANPEIRISLGQNARKFVEDNFFQKPVRDFERLILNIISVTD